MESVRLDKWLWAARFFKTRSLAAEAVNGGKVHVNGNRAKPAYAVKPGEEVRIRRGTFETTVVVQEVAERRGPAPEAQQLYQETEASRERRQRHRDEIRAQASPILSGRPDKRARRQSRRMKGKEP